VSISAGGDRPGAHLAYEAPAPPGDAVPPGRDLFVAAREPGEARAMVQGAQLQVPVLWDARGRMVVLNVREGLPPSPVPGVVAAELNRFDLATGERLALPGVAHAWLSPDAATLLYRNVHGTVFARSLDDRERTLGYEATQVRFVERGLYYRSGENLIWLDRDEQEPAIALTGAVAWAPVPRDRRSAVLALATLVREVELRLIVPGEDFAGGRPIARLPASGPVTIAPDGTRVAFLHAAAGQVRLRVVTLESGAEQSVELGALPSLEGPGPDGRPNRATVAFRPGSDEIWCMVHTALRVWRPSDGSVVAVELGPRRTRRVRGGGDTGVALVPSAEGPTGDPSFTADGRFWLFRTATRDQVMLGNADDPASDAGLPLGDPDGVDRLVELDGGRRLGVWVRSGERPPGVLGASGPRTELVVVDLPAGRTLPTRKPRLVLGDAHAAVVGDRFALAIVRTIGREEETTRIGDLVHVDLVTGRETLVAQSVSELALAPACAGCDALARGTPFGYLVNTRLRSGFEGLWSGELP
jgi:hypothetical protein